jgi:hypothetical protein
VVRIVDPLRKGEMRLMVMVFVRMCAFVVFPFRIFGGTVFTKPAVS